MKSEKEQFLQTWGQEHATTAKVIAAIPEGKLDFKPHETSRSARELAWHLVNAERFFAESCLIGKVELAPGPPPPASLKEIQSTYDRQYRTLVEKLKQADDQQLSRPIQIPTGPKQMGQVPAIGILWMGVVMHCCHHRGQLSLYLRLMGAKVPSIYGPSGDEPWF
ncbi:MAG TPA: DinB family protein [Candidatus Methylomirabilis sp.]|nr:DinB family protein [Candidatus Methylomirabilis sp.]